MVSLGPGQPSSTPFKRLGAAVYKRRKYVVVGWIVALVLVVPVIANVGNVTSLQQGSAAGSELESVKAANLISTLFARSVPNTTLLVVVSGNNVSSPLTQRLVTEMVSALRADKSIVGLNQTIDVYSSLYSAIKGLNNATFTAEKGANSTANLLLGVPALYLGAWQSAYSSTQNITEANAIANQTAAGTLYGANSTAFQLYSSHVLALFYTNWASSWTDPATATTSVLARATVASKAADLQYLEMYSKDSEHFARAVLNSITFKDYLTDNSTQAASRLVDFATGYVANSTSFSTKFVMASYSLGRTYSNSSLYRLVSNIIWNPSRYGVDRAFSELISSLVSPSRDTTLISLGLNRSSNTNLVRVRSDVQGALTWAQALPSVQSALVTGEDAISYDFGASTQDDLGLILPVTIVLLLVATGLFFRSILTPFITLGTIGVALGISQVFIVLVGTYVAKVDFTIPTILLTVIIGVGTDYSVFVIARYREERVKGRSVQQAIETSVTWAGESIATSGATVIISFLALTLTSVVYLKTMGMVVGLGVLVALAVALTLVPSVVGMVGGRTFWPNSGDRFRHYSLLVLSKLHAKRGYFSRSGTFAVKNARVLVVLAVVASIPALYVYATTVPTYDFISAAPGSLESVSASNHLSSSFGGGRIFPTYVVMTFSRPLAVSNSFDKSEMATVGAVSSQLAALHDVRNVTSPTNPYGAPVAYLSLNSSFPGDARTLAAIVQSIGTDNKSALIRVNLAIDPYSTQAISDAQTMRQSLHSTYGSSDGITGIYIGGASGSILDTKNVFDAQFNSVVPVVAVGVALVLLLVLGSLFLPVFAVFSVLMSIVWTLAATKIVFQAYFNYQILFITPFFLFVTLLGLGMDYNVFILTRIREEATKGKVLNDAIIGAIEQTGGIITAAAIILAGSLGALMLSSDLILKQMGFAFAFSILIDALIVRTYLVPAAMSTMGRWNWYSPIARLNRSHALFEQGATEASEQ
jgi:RND superfamily putative drug exporter